MGCDFELKSSASARKISAGRTGVESRFWTVAPPSITSIHQPSSTMTATAPQDSRFDTSAWSTQEAEAGPSKTAHSSASDEGSEAEEDEEQDDDEDELNNDDAEGNTSPLPSSLIPTLTPKELEAFERKQRKRGIIYISRIPPGMTPPKVRHLLSGFGEVERIYLQDGRRKEREREQGSTGVGMGGKRKKSE